MRALSECDDLGGWSEDEARLWWETRGRAIRAERLARNKSPGDVSSLPLLSIALDDRLAPRGPNPIR
jgi:hypothetical protein